MSLKRFSGDWPALRVVLPGSRSCVCTCRVHVEPHPPPLDPKDPVRDEPPHVVQGELVRDREDAREVAHGHRLVETRPVSKFGTCSTYHDSRYQDNPVHEDGRRAGPRGRVMRGGDSLGGRRLGRIGHPRLLERLFWSLRDSRRVGLVTLTSLPLKGG